MSLSQSKLSKGLTNKQLNLVFPKKKKFSKQKQQLTTDPIPWQLTLPFPSNDMAVNTFGPCRHVSKIANQLGDEGHGHGLGHGHGHPCMSGGRGGGDPQLLWPAPGEWRQLIIPSLKSRALMCLSVTSMNKHYCPVGIDKLVLSAGSSNWHWSCGSDTLITQTTHSDHPLFTLRDTNVWVSGCLVDVCLPVCGKCVDG